MYERSIRMGIRTTWYDTFMHSYSNHEDYRVRAVHENGEYHDHAFNKHLEIRINIKIEIIKITSYTGSGYSRYPATRTKQLAISYNLPRYEHVLEMQPIEC